MQNFGGSKNTSDGGQGFGGPANNSGGGIAFSAMGKEGQKTMPFHNAGTMGNGGNPGGGGPVSFGHAGAQAYTPANVGPSAPVFPKTKTSVFRYQGQRLEIRDVYNDTLEHELACIRDLIPRYKYVAMDTEFPGVIARPVGENPDQQYQIMRCNVDLLKIIQLGVAFLDEDGNVAAGCPCWQFNFSFTLEEDMYAQDSIELLQRSGIDFQAHDTRGIDVHNFGELLISSGLVLMKGITWITFHGGYDFGYLLKVLTCKPLPAEEKEFFSLLQTYFPSVFDLKFMAKQTSGFLGGLNQLAEDLGVERIGQMHQAGSDSLLTGQAFFKLRAMKAGSIVGTENVLYGLGADRTHHMMMM